VRDALENLIRCWLEAGGTPFRWGHEEKEAAVEMIRHGMRSTWRFFKRQPLQATVVVGTLVLALGANTTLFAVARALLIRDLPYADAERIIQLRGSAVRPAPDGSWVVDPLFEEAPGVEDAALFIPGGWANLTEAGEASRVKVSQASTDFFSVLGVSPLLGPGLVAADQEGGVAVLSHGLWLRAFGADPAILSRPLVLNGRSHRIVGVAPSEVSYPEGTEVWVSFPVEFDFFGNALGPDVVARLAPGVAIPAMEGILEERFLPRVEAAAEAGYEMPLPELVPIRDQLVRDVRRPLGILMAGAGFVFLLGCLNLAGVWLSRTLEREEELGVRCALGAGRLRLFLQLLSETVGLGLVGGGIGVAVAWAGSRFLRSWLPGDLPGVLAIGLDPLTLVFALALAVLAGLGIGGLSAMSGARKVFSGRIRWSSSGLENRRAQTLLAVGQGALALVLLVAATLTVRSFHHLRAQSLGFDPGNAMMLRARVPAGNGLGGIDPGAYARALLDGLGDLGGIEAAGITNSPPLSFEAGSMFRVRRPGDGEEQAVAVFNAVATSGYFRAAGIRFLEGRTFDEGTPFEGSPQEAREVILDGTLAATLFPGGGAVGSTVEMMSFRAGSWVWVPMSVRGVVERVMARGARNEAYPTLYRDYWAGATPNISVVVRTRGDPAERLDAIRRVALAVNPEIAPFGVRTMEAVSADVIAADGALAVVCGCFSLVALLLVGLGLYGMVARQINLRRRELGIRLALGARPGELVGSLARDGLIIGSGTLLVGIPGAIAGTRVLQATLFQLDATDPLSLLAGCAGVMLLSLAAAWLPARRAARVNVMESLAAE
jgi:putative ABC transport system permease protein